MEKLQNRLSDWHLREIHQIKTLLLEYCPSADLILLYGELVDETPRSVAGGYEFLVVVKAADMIDREVLQDYITEQHPSPQRFVRRIVVQVLSTEFLRTTVQQTPYLYRIFRHGVVLHNPVPGLWDHINLRKEVKQKRIRFNNESVIRHLHFADIFFTVSSQLLEWKYWHLNPFFMYYCLEHLCIAMELCHYGFTRDYHLLSQRFEMAKHGFPAIYQFAEEKKDKLSRLFRTLTRQKDSCPYRSNTDGYQLSVLLTYDKLIRELMTLVKKECGWPDDEVESVPKERIPESTLLVEEM